MAIENCSRIEGRFQAGGTCQSALGQRWDELFAKDPDGLLAARLEQMVDGDEQRILTADGATIRKELFNSDRLQSIVSHLSDEQLVDLCEDVGGHDFVKLHAAYAQATAHKGQPTVVLIRTIKGFGLGPAFAGRNTTHQKKKADMETIRFILDDLGLDFSERARKVSLCDARRCSSIVAYARQRRFAMDGFMPKRTVQISTLCCQRNICRFDEGTKGNMQVS